MELFQWGVNPWGQPILTHISWDLLWWALALGILFVLVHTVYVRVKRPMPPASEEAAEPASGGVARLPERIERHSRGARVFHWLMTVAMLALLATGFLPIVGLQFAWVTLHWIAGLALIVALVYHLVHAFLRRSLVTMWVTMADRRDARLRLRRALGASAPPPGMPGKYPLENKLYHHVVALTSVVVVATGLVMMVRVPTPFFTRNPYLLSDFTWGIVYVLHGVASVALVTLIVAHVYLAVRAEKRWITWSMITGWIDRRDYLEHHDPARWVVAPASSPEGPVGAPAAR